MNLRGVALKVLNFFKNATVKFAGGVLLLVAFGASAELIAHNLMPADSWAALLLRGLGEAVLISAMLALIVDPYLKRRLRDESGWEVLFGYLNPMAPKHLREALKELASCKTYNTEVVWTVTFTWVDPEQAILALTIESFSASLNLDRRPQKIDERPWVLASIGGYQSEYLRYSLSCPGYFQPIDLRDAELQPYVETHDNRSISLDDERMAAGRLLPPGVHFENIRVARMYRHGSGYLPLQHGKFAEKVAVVLKGDALSDLDIIVSIPRRVHQKDLSEWRRRAAPPSEHNSRKKLGQVSPGQITLISWGPAKSIQP